MQATTPTVETYTRQTANKIAYHGAMKIKRAGSGYRIDKQSKGYYLVTTPDGFNLYGVTLFEDGKHGSCGCAFWNAAKEHEICKHVMACRWLAEDDRDADQAEADLDAAGDLRDLRMAAEADRAYSLAR